MGVYERIGSFVPRNIVSAFAGQLNYIGLEVPEKRFIGFLFIYGFFLSIGLALNTQLFFGINAIFSFPFYFGFFIALIYLWLSITAESKGKFVEKIIPDALQLIASNMKAGLTAEKSFLVSARPEFGPLEIELKRAAKKIAAGARVEDALVGISEKIKSKTLERTIWLISEGIKSGGEIGDLLIELSDDLREQESIQGEISANISMYILLIFFAAAFGAPLLFGISSFIVQILASQLANIPAIPAATTQGLPSNLSSFSTFGSNAGARISVDFIMLFSIISLALTTIFASLTIGVINSGKEKAGLKYILIIGLIGFSLFFIVRFALTAFFGKLLL
jgi:flagellar protein FlaJ